MSNLDLSGNTVDRNWDSEKQVWIRNRASEDFIHLTPILCDFNVFCLERFSLMNHIFFKKYINSILLREGGVGQLKNFLEKKTLRSARKAP